MYGSICRCFIRVNWNGSVYGVNVADPVAYALRTVGEDRIAGLLSVGAIAGLTTVLLVAMFAFVRVSYSMSRDGLLPKRLSSVHKRLQTPFF